MIKMNIHWEKLGGKGTFTVTANSVEECMELAREEVEKGNSEMTDWYVIY